MTTLLTAIGTTIPAFSIAPLIRLIHRIQAISKQHKEYLKQNLEWWDR